MKLDRLLSIIVLLMRKDRVRARELAGMFDVSVRTILRDIEAINLAGIPIVTYQGVNGGIGIAEGYRIDKNILTTDDMASIITSLKGMAGAVPGNTHEILMAKMRSVMSPYQLEAIDLKAGRLVIDPSPWGENKKAKERLDEMVTVIKKAIEESHMIEFSYSDSSGNKTRRKVEPYSLILKGRNWYLNAWCAARQDFRLFKLSRIKDLTLTAEHFESRDITPLGQAEWTGEWHKSRNMVTLELVFEKELEFIAEELFADDCSRAENGKLSATISLPENNWLYGFLLSFGPGIEVANPPHIRSILAEAAKEIFDKYS
jgi:predicted DNA-binding transcriptional regulator YafY